MDDRQQPRDLQGLLRFALQYTKSEDAPNPTVFQEMDLERRQYLENVLKSMTIDVVAELEKAINILENDESTSEERVGALEAIKDFVDDIDTANNLVKIGGTKVILSCLDSKDPNIRAAASSLIAEMSQNNPFCQKHFLEQAIFPKLIDLLSDDEKVSCSAMRAISCLTRNYEPCLAAFIDIGGLECILGCLQIGNEKIFTRACFLMDAFSSEFPAVKDELIKLGAVDKLIDYVSPCDKYSGQQETILSALNALTDSGSSFSHFPGLDRLRDSLNEIVKLSTGKPEFEEIMQYAKTLLERCPTEDSSKDADR